MKIQKLFGFLFCGIILFSSVQILSQDMSKDQLFLIIEEIAKVDKYYQYEETSKEWVTLMTEAGLDIPRVHASQRDDFHFYYLIPIENYGELDKVHEKLKSAYEKWDKQKTSVFEKKSYESIESFKRSVVKWSAELSYIPKEPHLKKGEGKFMHWIFINYKVGKKDDIKSILKEWKELYGKNNLPYEYDVWTMEMGENANTIVISEMYKDGADFYNSMNDISSKIKEDEDKLWEKFSAFLISAENKYGRIRPDLSYIKK